MGKAQWQHKVDATIFFGPDKSRSYCPTHHFGHMPQSHRLCIHIHMTDKGRWLWNPSEIRRVNTAGQNRGRKYPPTPSCVVLTQAQHGPEKYPPPLCPAYGNTRTRRFCVVLCCVVLCCVVLCCVVLCCVVLCCVVLCCVVLCCVVLCCVVLCCVVLCCVVFAMETRKGSATIA